MKQVKQLLLVLFLLATVGVRAQVAIGVATADASAMLDITSPANNKGLLIPRMTSGQRSAIGSLAEGLLVYQTDAPVGFYFYKTGVWTIIGTGTLALTTTGTSGAATLVGNTLNIPVYSGASIHFIGETFGGGIVFYITPDALHGLVAETQDQGIYNCFEAQDGISTSGNHSLAGQNFTDWRLPTKNELNLLYIQRAVVGGFASVEYWSSSEYDYTISWYQDFGNGLQDMISKFVNFYRVRAVRAF